MDIEKACIYRLLSQTDWGQIQGLYLVAEGLWATYRTSLSLSFYLP